MPSLSLILLVSQMYLDGLPPATVSGATSRPTMLCAATSAPLPTLTPGSTTLMVATAA